MALTREDLVASLRDFKAELCLEIKHDLRTSIDQLKADLTDCMSALKQDVDAAGSRVLEIEDQAEELDTRTTRMQEKQKHQVLLKVEDLENRS